jgi:hypothetical protein
MNNTPSAGIGLCYAQAYKQMSQIVNNPRIIPADVLATGNKTGQITFTFSIIVFSSLFLKEKGRREEGERGELHTETKIPLVIFCHYC